MFQVPTQSDTKNKKHRVNVSHLKLNNENYCDKKRLKKAKVECRLPSAWKRERFFVSNFWIQNEPPIGLGSD